jgi:Rieske Fe-S protein
MNVDGGEGGGGGAGGGDGEVMNTFARHTVVDQLLAYTLNAPVKVLAPELGSKYNGSTVYVSLLWLAVIALCVHVGCTTPPPSRATHPCM